VSREQPDFAERLGVQEKVQARSRVQLPALLLPREPRLAPIFLASARRRSSSSAFLRIDMAMVITDICKA